MTRQSFIRKWLGNRDYSFNAKDKDLMLKDLDKVIKYSNKSNINEKNIDILCDGYYACEDWSDKSTEENTKKGWLTGFKYLYNKLK